MLILRLAAALAVATAGSCVFALYAVALSRDSAPTGADRELLDFAGDIHGDGLVDLAQLVTDLGSFFTVATLVASAVVLLVLRRRFGEALTLAAGALLLYAAVRLAKEGIDRPRPPRPLEPAAGSSFPSGHAAYSTSWVALALLACGALRGLASRAALLALALALALAIGLSRIYLRVHFWSDVAGGWGLGAGVLGACATITLIVSYMRQNGRRPGASRGRP